MFPDGENQRRVKTEAGKGRYQLMKQSQMYLAYMLFGFVACRANIEHAQAVFQIDETMVVVDVARVSFRALLSAGGPSTLTSHCHQPVRSSNSVIIHPLRLGLLIIRRLCCTLTVPCILNHLGAPR